MGNSNWLKGVVLASLITGATATTQAQPQSSVKPLNSSQTNIEDVIETLGPWAQYMTSTQDHKIFSNTVEVELKPDNDLSEERSAVTYDARDDRITINTNPKDTPEFYGEMAYAFSKAFTDTIGIHGLHVSPYFQGPPNKETAQFLEEHHMKAAYTNVRNRLRSYAAQQGRHLLVTQFQNGIQGIIDLYKITKKHPAQQDVLDLTKDLLNHVESRTESVSDPQGLRKLYTHMQRGILELQVIHPRLEDLLDTIDKPEVDAIRQKINTIWDMSPTAYEEETLKRLTTPQERLARDLQDLYSLNLASGRIDQELLDFLERQHLHRQPMHAPQIRKARLGLQMIEDGIPPKRVQQDLLQADTYTYNESTYNFGDE